MTQTVATINARRPIPLTRARGYPFQNLPLLLVMSFLFTVFAVFLIWPINWPIYNGWIWTLLIAYVALCLGALAFGYTAGRATDRRGTPLRSFGPVLPVIVGGAGCAIVLLFPSSYIYTGRWPWDVLAALQDQGDAYRSLTDQLLLTTGQRGPIALARALVAPLTFAVIPLGILYWKRLGQPVRILVIATALCSVTLSLMRGTDRELADLFIIGGSAFLVSIGRQNANSAHALALIRKYWLPAILLATFVWVAASLFTERRNERLGGYNRLMVCANDSRICADIDAPLISWMPLEQRFGMSLFVLSSASGFYGLSLGLEKDFEPTWGVGHSPAALAIYELVTGDQSVRARTYTYRNGIDGWSEENYWSTLILWLANDFGFVGAVVVLGLIGFVWGRAWRDATQRGSDPAAIIFCLTMVMLAYLPANNQVFANYDGYSVFVVWLVIWMRQASLRVPATPRLS